MQVPNLPTGRFTQPGPPGTCQCITNDRDVDMKCVTSAAACESICASRSYSFVPDALLSCRGGGASPVAAAPSIPPAGNRPMSPR